MSIYPALNIYHKVMVRLFYKRIKISGKEKVPLETPKVFVTNHQNAFLDAIIMAAVMKEPLHFLTRASVFKKPFVKWLLSLVNMMPIYRIRDGLAAVKKNDEVFEQCIEILQNKGSLLIFAEGNHSLQRSLRPLQKGVSRIVFEAERRNAFNLTIQVIPVGMNYDNHSAFRDNFFMNIGDPIPVKDFEKEYETKDGEAMNSLKNRLSDELKPLILTINDENYSQTERIWLENRKRQKDLKEQFDYDQKLIYAIESGEFKEEGKNKILEKKYFWANPICWYAAINHFFPFFIMSLILKPIKDRAFWASLKFTLGYVLVPLFYSIQFILVYALSNNLAISLAYLFSLPLIGLAVYDYYKSTAL
ncbi:MAG: lysophospholipid acyltransferase family protein [Cyclobacteriaceae bacterium]|nr:lysophospholipid acyltransferase family protein [Cyclobacteriaceae bacterium]